MAAFLHMQNLSPMANIRDVQRFFICYKIPDDGIQIIGGPNGDAFIKFVNDADLLDDLILSNNSLLGDPVTLSVVTSVQMNSVDQKRSVQVELEPPPETAETVPADDCGGENYYQYSRFQDGVSCTFPSFDGGDDADIINHPSCDTQRTSSVNHQEGNICTDHIPKRIRHCIDGSQQDSLIDSDSYSIERNFSSQNSQVDTFFGGDLDLVDNSRAEHQLTSLQCHQDYLIKNDDRLPWSDAYPIRNKLTKCHPGLDHRTDSYAERTNAGSLKTSSLGRERSDDLPYLTGKSNNFMYDNTYDAGLSFSDSNNDIRQNDNLGGCDESEDGNVDNFQTNRIDSLRNRKAPSVQEMAREAYIKKNITETLGLALKTLQQKHVHSEEPIYSEDHANTVCNILEAVFLHGLKASFSQKLSSYLIGVDHSKNRQPSFWELLTRFSHKDVVSQLNHLGQITTEIGMCRAWLRVALNEGVLESYLDAMLADSGALRHFYKRTAYLRDDEQAGILKSYSQGIQNFRFQLSYNSSVLNIWTTTPLVLTGLLEQTATPRSILSTSVSESALSQMSVVSSASEDQEMIAEDHHVHRSKISEPRIVSSRSYHGDLRGAATSPPTPPNSPYNPASLSRMEIEEIRKFTERLRSTGSASTPTSQISCPDYMVDGRFVSSPDTSTDYLRPSTRSPICMRGWTQNQGGGASVDMSIEEEVLQQGNGAWGGVPTEAEDSTLTLHLGVSSTVEQCDPGNTSDDNCDISELVSGSLVGGAAEDSLLTEAAGGEQPLESHEIQPSAAQTNVVEEELVEKVTVKSQTKTTGSSTPHQTSAIRPKTIEAPITSQSSSSITLPPLQLNRKSQVLQPVLTNATAQVEVAREVSPTTTLLSSASDPDDAAGGETGIYDEFPPSPQSNQLGAMEGHGWSSEFQEPEVACGQVKEEVPARVSLHQELSTQESYNSLLQNYTPGVVPAASMSQVLDTLPGEAQGMATSPLTHTAHTEELVEEYVEYLEDYDVLPVGLNVMSGQADARTQQLVALIGQICNEKGLDQQNYQCNGCSRPIGMIYGKARECAYDGCYYCYECHENEEAIIPSRIVHNWDFSKHKVARHTVQFLKQIEEDPLLNIQHINPRLYDHVSEVKQVREVRTQLRFLKAYLFTCKQSVADDLRKQVWPREYLYDDIHVYSVQDLLQVLTGQLVASLRKVIKYASKHVYSCRLCSQKGFICEVCASPKVIYPFEADTTSRCEQCNAVYHRECKPASSECPKCVRRRQRQMSLGSEMGEPDTVDYAYVPEPVWAVK